MKKIVLLLLCCTSLLAAQTVFDDFFTDRTMRFDYYHTGTADAEFISPDEIVLEGPWSGSQNNLIDTLNCGNYLVKIFDLKTNRMIYSFGYSTIFGEYQTTLDAKNGMTATYHESVRFPVPRKPVQLTLAVRNRQNLFTDIYTTTIDPGSRQVNREEIKPVYNIDKYMINGEPKNKVDLVIVGDGYTKDEIAKYHKDIDRYLGDFFSHDPFKSRKKDFNIWVIDVISQDSGIDEPTKNAWRHTTLNCSYNSLGSPRYVLTSDNKTLRTITASVPYDQIYILVNSTRYGGGGIYNWFSTSFTGEAPGKPGWWSDYVFVHEFGHAFAGLADEYYTSSTSYDEFYAPGIEPWEPNVTRMFDPKHVKWGQFIKAGTPIPTPWEKAAYDSLGAILQSELRDSPEYIATEVEMRKVINNSAWQGVTGCFEGGGYCATGVYRPCLDCRMFSKSLVDFCTVCQDAISRVIDFRTQ